MIQNSSLASIRGFVDFAVQGSSPAGAEANGRVRGPGLDLHVSAPARIAVDGTRIAVASGTPRFAAADSGNDAATWLSLWRDQSAAVLQAVKDAYSVVLIDLGKRTALLATDRFSICPLCYSFDGRRLRFADRADAVSARAEQTVDPQAIYDYLYFHMVPAPRTAFKNVRRLPAGHALLIEKGTARTTRHWNPAFDVATKESMSDLAARFRHLLTEAVARSARGKPAGSFLSGGTDSSTIAGLLCKVTGAPAPTFSIGFDADGYDEMAYARIAAEHFRTLHNEYYVTPADLISVVPSVARQYDQPFGNSSVVPAYYCAKMATEFGVETLLAGDGGDELFGGNSRYAKQKVFALYERIPDWLRARLIEPLLVDGSPAERLRIVKKASSYVSQARIPMPDRMETYNLLAQLDLAEMLEDGFAAAVDPNEPLARQREVYADSAGSSLIDRMLAYDWQFTLADNDLPKVNGACALANVAVRFPMLADELVDFSTALAPALKVKRLRLRYFFKEALRGFLPAEIIAKKKHGFGMPFGVWLIRDPPLLAFARESLDRLGEQGIVRKRFIKALLQERLREHPAYFGEMVWVLMMLSEWIAARSTVHDDHLTIGIG